MNLLERRRAMISALAKSPSLVFLEYIESTGTQYIITDKHMQDVDTVEAKLSLTDTTKYPQNIIASRNNSSATGTALDYVVFNGTRGLWYYPFQWSGSGEIPSQNEIFTTKTEFINGTAKFYINGVPKDTFNYNTSEYTSTYFIFIGANLSASQVGIFDYFSYTRFYGITFSKDGTLVRDFVPCKKGNEVGLYDLVNHKFYGNDGTGSFIAGPDIGYQPVKYLESTGTQYIDTGYTPKNNSGMRLKASTSVTYDGVYVGCRDNTSTDSRFTIASNSSYDNELRAYSGFSTNDAGSLRFPITLNTAFEYKLNYMNNRKRICNNVELSPITVTLYNFTRSVYIGGMNYGGSFAVGQSAKFYSVIITEGNSIVHNFIPCYRKSDNVAGMYDLVTGTFYTNAGTGSFIVGPDVN